jgi:PAS domain S-box-containing protein
MPISAVDAETIRQAQELVHVGTWVVDFEPCEQPDLRSAVVRWSNELYRMLGLRPHSIPLEVDTLIQFVHEGDRQRVAQVIETALKSKIPFRFDSRLVRGDGKERVYHVRGNVACDELGRVVRMVGTVVDITDRVLAEQARAESEARFRAVFEQAAIGIAVGGADRRFVSVNETFAKLLGYEVEDLVDKTFVEVTHPDDAAVTVDRFSGSLDSPTTYEKRYLRSDGQTVWARVTASPLRRSDGQPGGFIGIVEDISKRKAADEALARQTEILRGILDHMPVMVVHLDAAGQLLYSNREAIRVFGWAINGDTPEDILAATFPDAIARALVKNTITGGGAQWVDVEPLARDGRVVPSSWSGVKLPDGTLLLIGQDLTERRSLQQRLAHVQKMEALGQLAGGVAHDFNNILTIILSCATFVQDAAVADSSVAADSKEIIGACQRATALTRQLLAFSQRQMLQPEVVNMNEAVTLLATTTQRLIGENIHLKVETGAEHANVEVDRNQLEQVILNLAVNAREAIGAQGTITLATRNRVSNNGLPQMVLSVSDNGVGIDADVRHRIFEPFFTTKPAGKSTGLGLSTVLGIVEQSGGTVELDSAPGVGTEFRVVLPCVTTSGRARQPAEPAEVGGTETVLLVEDEAAVRLITRRLLTGMGYQVIEARHGRDALELAAARPSAVDLLVTDVVMPEMGGRELSERIREAWPGVPVLFMSGYTDDELLRKGTLDRGFKLLRKPFTKTELAQAVRGLIQSQPEQSPCALT